ncbi:hypothetical protein [Clostridium perfringens]|nr:hypothetical protein [Clostridium perfringens]
MAKEELREEMEQIEKDLAFIKEHDPKAFYDLLEVMRVVVEKGTN